MVNLEDNPTINELHTPDHRMMERLRAYRYDREGVIMSELILNDKFMRILQLCRKRDYSTIEYLSEEIGKSKRSVINYINELNKELKGIAAIKNKRGKGYYLSIINHEKYKEILEQQPNEIAKQDSLQKRIAFIIQKLMNNNENNTLDELAYQMNISRSTLVNDLKKASVVLETYNLKIVGKQNKGMCISGDELSLRFFIIDNIYDYLYKESPLNSNVKEAIMRVARKYDFETTTIKRLIHSVVIMLDRLLNGHQIEKMDEKYGRLIGTSEHEIALEITSAIEKALSFHIPKQEVLFITIPISGRRTPTRNSLIANTSIPSEINNLLSSIVKRIAFEMGIVLEINGITKDLEYHLLFMINRLIFDIRISNPLISEVKEKYPLAYKMAEIAGEVIYEKFNVLPSIHELGYLAFYFSIYLSKHDVKVKNFNRIAIVCGTGRGTARFIEIQLRGILGKEPVLESYSEENAKKELLASYDLVFTTIPLNYQIDVPVIRISEIFNENAIAKQMDKAIYLQNYKISSLDTRSSIISAMIEPDKFFILEGKTYLENVLKMASSLVEKGYVDPDFPERLMKREKKSTMVFDRHIALPHTVNYGSDQIIISIGILPEKIEFHDKQIELIFLLGLPENTNYDTGLLVKIYDDIIKIGSDDKLIQQLSSCTSFEDFIMQLNEKEM